MLTDALRETLAVFDSPGRPWTTPEVADRLDLGRRSTYERLERLVEQGRLETKKVGANARVWWRSVDSASRVVPDWSAAAESLVADVLDDIEVGIFVLDENYEIAWINAAIERFFGLDRDGVLGRDKRVLLEEHIAATVENSETFTETVLATYEDNTYTERFECRVTPGEGRDARWLEHRSKPIESGAYAGGRVELYYDVSDRVRSENIRREERREFESLVEAVEEYAIFMLDAEGDVRTWNRDAERIKGYEAEEIVGEHFSTFYTEAERAAGVPEENLAVIRDSDGDIFAAPGVSQDITQREERERELERYATLFEESKDVNVIVAPDGTFRYVTPSAKSVFGYEPEELVGEVGFEYIHPDDREEAMSEFATMLETPDYEPTVEFRFEHKDGSWIVLEALARDLRDDPAIDGVVIYTRDITERHERQQKLQRRVRQQEVVTTLGQRAFEEDDIDALMAAAAELVADTLDNDYCKVLDLDAGAEELMLRQGVGWTEGVVGSATVSAIEDDSQAAYTLASEQPVVVEDLRTETRFSGPDLLRNHDVRSGVSTIIGPYESPWGILGTHDTVPKNFSEEDVNFVQSVANILASAIAQHRDEQELKRQREQLAALNNLNDVVREITDAVIEQSSREEIEETVCERLAETDSYTFAWIAEVDPQTQSISPRVEAGVEGYLEEIDLSVAPEDSVGRGPSGKAVRTGEMQVSADVFADPDFEPWQEYAHAYGYRASAAIPITHEGTLYGLLGLYADRPNAFDAGERKVIGQLGEIVGHAIAAIERKQALMGNEVTELEFHVPAFFETAGVELEGDVEGTITIDRVVGVEEDVFLEYGSVEGGAIDALEALAEHHPDIERLRISDRETGPSRFELRVAASPFMTAVASHGGHLQQATIEDGDLSATVHLPFNGNVREVVDAIEGVYPEATVFRRRQVTREEPDTRVHHAVTEELTDRQRTVLEAAVYAGFFEWPRDASGEEIADSLGIAAPTFHQHLRKAQRKTFDAVFSTATGT